MSKNFHWQSKGHRELSGIKQRSHKWEQMQAIYSQLAITGQSLLFVFGKDSKAGRDRGSFIVKKKRKVSCMLLLEVVDLREVLSRAD